MQTKNSNNFLLAVFTCVLSVQTCRGADATGLMPGVYTEGADGKFIAVTNNNISTLWPGVWRENTNGLRVQLQSETESGQPLLHIGVAVDGAESWGPAPRLVRFWLASQCKFDWPPEPN